jgi:hypothetical protein
LLDQFEGSLWHKRNARELTGFLRCSQRCDASNARIAHHLMVDDWFVGKICHKISRLFPADGQGLLQHDKDRSEGNHLCVKPAFIGVRFDCRGYLIADRGSCQVLVKATHAVVPELISKHRHTRASFISPPSAIFHNFGKPEEDRKQLAFDEQIFGVFKEAAYHDKFDAKEIERRHGHFFCEENGQPTPKTQQTVPSDEQSCQKCLWQMGKWPGHCSIHERPRQSNVVII